MRTVNAKKGCVIPIGRLGENEATQVVFDIADWLEQFGEGVFSLLAQRNGDALPYPSVVERDGDKLLWNVKDADVSIVGYGKCELIYTVGDTVAKSEIYTTVVGSALTGGGEVPEPYEDWVQRVVEAASQAEISKDEAERAAQASFEYGTKPAIIGENGNWYIWDAESKEYQDSGFPASVGGVGDWNNIRNKPFGAVGDNLKVVNGALTVDTANEVEQDNTKPITSAAVYTEVGNINALLSLI